MLARTHNDNGADSGGVATSRRRWRFALRYLAVLAGFTLLLLGTLEFGLRAAGYGYDAAPFLKHTFNGQRLYIRNRHFLEQFAYWPVRMEAWEMDEFVLPAEKPPNTCRIFVFGESAPAGWPDARFSFARFLKVMLEAKYPGAHFEVYNAAFRALNSHVFRVEAQRCVQFQPDVYVVYLGNNEVHGPFGLMNFYHTAPKLMPLPLIRGYLSLQDLRIVQLTSSARYYMLFLTAVLGLRDTSPVLYPNDARVGTVYDHFSANLKTICQTVLEAGGKAVLTTVPVNLRDWKPAKSYHLRALSDADLQNWQGAYDAGRKWQESGAFAQALDAWASALSVDDTYADLQFRAAQCYWALGRYDAAAQGFARAHELDSFDYVRAKAAANDVVKQVAAEFDGQGVYLADTEAYVRTQAAHGCPGMDLFFDFCHFNMKGSYLVAQALFEPTCRALPDWVRNSTPGRQTPLTYEECLARTGLSAILLRDFLKGHVNAEREFRTPEGQAELERQLAEADTDFSRRGHAGLVEAYHNAIESGTADYLARALYARSLIEAGDLAAAETWTQSLVEQFPHWRMSNRLLGTVLARLEKPQQAEEAFRRQTHDFPDDLATYEEWVRMLRAGGKTQELLAVLRAAIDNDPFTDSRRCRQGDLHAERGQWKKALGAYRSAIDYDRNFRPAYEHLDDLFVRTNDARGRVQAWEDLTLEYPDAARAFFYLGKALETAGEAARAVEAYRKAVELSPQDDMFRQGLERALTAGNAGAAAGTPGT